MLSPQWTVYSTISITLTSLRSQCSRVILLKKTSCWKKKQRSSLTLCRSRVKTTKGWSNKQFYRSFSQSVTFMMKIRTNSMRTFYWHTKTLLLLFYPTEGSSIIRNFLYLEISYKEQSKKVKRMLRIQAARALARCFLFTRLNEAYLLIHCLDTNIWCL